MPLEKIVYYEGQKLKTHNFLIKTEVEINRKFYWAIVVWARLEVHLAHLIQVA